MSVRAPLLPLAKQHRQLDQVPCPDRLAQVAKVALHSPANSCHHRALQYLLRQAAANSYDMPSRACHSWA